MASVKVGDRVEVIGKVITSVFILFKIGLYLCKHIP